MDERTNTAIANAFRISLMYHYYYHGYGVFQICTNEVPETCAVIAEIKMILQRDIDPNLIVTSMVYAPNGDLIVSFDSKEPAYRGEEHA